MSRTIFSRPTADTPGALCLHDPLYFATQPQARSTMNPQAASRLLYISNWKLSSESAREEPRLRKILGHASVYDKTRTFSQPRTCSPDAQSKNNELSTYLQNQVPSFKEFQAAIQDQLITLAKVTAAAAQLSVDEYKSEEEEDDSDYDSYDGDDWSDEDPAAESDDSFTDNESIEGQSSECSSPTSPSYPEEDDSELWAVRPLTPYINNKSIDFR